METRPPESLVGIDVPDPGQEVLVHQQRLQPAPAPGAHREKAVRRELVGERLLAEGQNATGLALRRHTRIRIASVQADPPELAHVAESQLAAVGQLEHDMDVTVLGRRRGNDEELSGHLEVNRQDGCRAARWVGRIGRTVRIDRNGGRPRRRVECGLRRRTQHDQQLFATPADAHYLAARNRRGEGRCVVAAQRPGPVRPHPDDPRPHHQAAQVPGDRFDFR